MARESAKTDSAKKEEQTALAAPAEQRKSRPAEPARKLLPPYKVILHNDDVNEMLYVVQTIRKLTGLPREEAIQKMWEAHRSGSAMLLVTHRERAELYVGQFASCGLTATAEPDA